MVILIELEKLILWCWFSLTRFLNISKKIKVKFEDIPVETNFVIFDKQNSKENKEFWKITKGDSTIEFKLPTDWKEPYFNFRISGWWIPNTYCPIKTYQTKIFYSGADFYVDIDREVHNEEMNQKSIENLITIVFNDEVFDGRQRFFISLLSLQSHFEFLVYSMLVSSDHISSEEFDELEHHRERTDKAFSDDNSNFFSDQLTICPGKESLGTIIPKTTRQEVKQILNTIRTLRNRVVHSWGYRNTDREELQTLFNDIGEQLDVSGTDDEFYTRATFIFVRLYARTSQFKNQATLLIEKLAVQLERKKRGYI